MEILVRRERGTKKSTPGKMFVNGKMFAYTMEDVERPGVAKDASKKVYGKTAIPRGTYAAVVTKSNRFKRDMVLLLKVPQFEGIRVHSGNTAEDSHGCVLVARNRAGKDKVYGDSRKLESLLTKMVTKAISNREKITFKVVHEDGGMYAGIDEGQLLELPEVKV